jgi:hypothetical protein
VNKKIHKEERFDLEMKKGKDFQILFEYKSFFQKVMKELIEKKKRKRKKKKKKFVKKTHLNLCLVEMVGFLSSDSTFRNLDNVTVCD